MKPYKDTKKRCICTMYICTMYMYLYYVYVLCICTMYLYYVSTLNNSCFNDCIYTQGSVSQCWFYRCPCLFVKSILESTLINPVMT